MSLFLLWGGWTLGGMGTYAVGRWLGRPAVRAVIGDVTLARFEDRISARTPFAVVLLFQFALPSEVPGFVLGLARYSFCRYLIALAVTELPYALGAIGLGKGLLERRTTLLVGIGCAMAAVTAWALVRLQKRIAP